MRREFRRGYPTTELITITRSIANDIKLTLCEALFFADSFVECLHFLKWSQISRKSAELSRIAQQAEVDERKELEGEEIDPEGVEEDIRAGRILRRATHTPDSIAYIEAQRRWRHRKLVLSEPQVASVLLSKARSSEVPTPLHFLEVPNTTCMVFSPNRHYQQVPSSFSKRPF